MGILGSIFGIPGPAVEIHAEAPATEKLNDRARLWAEATMAVYDEADKRFFSWEHKARREWIMEKLVEFGKSLPPIE